MLGRSRAADRSARKGSTRKFGKAARPRAAVFVVACALAGIVPFLASAQGVDLGLEYATSIGLTTTDIRTTIGRIINAFLAFLGLLAVILMLYAGFRWMTSGGNEEKISEAKRIMINATIGLVIILSAFAITQFIIRAITGEFPTNFGTGGSQPQSLAAFQSGASSALGNGIIDYHYPEAGQTDVPRNTNLSITFKRALVLSTVFQDYDDNGTFETSDDVFTPPLKLNTDNIKIIANQALEAPGTGGADDQFDARYANAVVDPAPGARITEVALPFNPNDTQTIVIMPVTPLGSATTDVTYRVAIRGGESGVRVWSPDPQSGDPIMENAFSSMTVDGAYFWPFATGTHLDLTPPQLSAVVPRTTPSPATRLIDRNQLLQVYFNEAVDPTTASGILGAGGGFTNIEVQARCLDGLPCVWGGGSTADFSTVPGTMYIGNKYRTAEFLPSAPCEGVTENSCGETVYCLPKNVELRVRTKAATLSAEPPKAELGDGVIDMAGNSFDGNDNGTAEGPVGPGRPDDFNLNVPQTDLSTVNDTAGWIFHVGENIDLVPPSIMNIDPVSPPPPETSHPVGPSRVPPDLPPTVLWSKVMSINSMRTGAFDEDTGDWADDRTTIAIRANECEKLNRDADCAAEGCPCDRLDPPSYFIDVGLGPIEVAGEDRTEMKIPHRIFFTANDLGYTEEDIAALPERIPIYQPVIRAQIRDSKQNCFYPSVGFECSGVNVANPSCCNRTAQGTYVCPL